MSEEAIGQFFSRAWGVYEKVVAADYLSHSLIYSGLREFLQDRREIRFLELGCGDARSSSELLRKLPVQAYLGIDTSLGALEKARLRRQEESWKFLVGDARQLPEVGADWTVALASFCLHHLSAAEKRRTLAQLRSRLAPSAVFLLVDLFREEAESRDDYLERRRAWMRAEWTALSDEELQLVMDHEQSADFPETVSDYQQWAREAGFQSARQSLVASQGMSRCLILDC